MFKSHAARNDICCPAHEVKDTTKHRPYYQSDRRTDYTREGTRRHDENSYFSEDDEYCSCDLSNFEGLPVKPIVRNRRGQTSKLATIARLREQHARDEGSILRTGKNCSSQPNHHRSTEYPSKPNRMCDKSSKFVERTQFPSSRPARNHSVRVKAKEADGRSKYRSKSLGAKIRGIGDHSVSAEIDENCRRKSKIEKSLRLEDKSGKIERRYSRRDVKKANGVTEVTSLEIVRNVSRQALSPTAANRGGEKTVGNTRWPSRKSTKVIFARYSQDSVDDDVSELSESLAVRDWSEDETCTCYDRPTKSFDRDIEDFSSECVDFFDESTTNDGMPFVDDRRASRRRDSCICYDCPMEENRVEDKVIGASRRKRDSEMDGRRSTQASNLDRRVRKGTRPPIPEKLIPDVTVFNNKHSSRRAKIIEKKASLRRVCAATNPDVQDRFSGHRGNFARQKVREDRTKREGPGRSTKRMASRVIERKSQDQHSEKTTRRHEKFCKMLNTPETRNMMSCCCAASQLDEDHGCSVDCRCPESFFPKRTESPETPNCPASCPEGHRETTGSALKNGGKRSGQARYRCRVKKEIPRTTEAGRENIGDRYRLSRIGYVEERDDECESNVALTERQIYGSDDRQPSENSCCPSVDDISTICGCDEVEPEVEPEETSGCHECLNIADLCPEVPPPDHWTKCGDRLKRVTEEYRILSSRLRDMQHEAETPQTSGRVRKRISRKYPSGKEFSFEVKTIGEGDRGTERTRDEDRDDDFCGCEEPAENPMTTRGEVISPGRSGSPNRYSRSEKMSTDGSTRAMNQDDFVPCDCSPLERKKRGWKANSDDTDVVKILEAFCAKAKAMDRELESTCGKKKILENVEADDCECDESDDVEESEFSCEKYCDACVGTDSTGKTKRVRSEEITMAPRIAKPCGASGKMNLKKIFIFPLDGEDGPPLTLLKKSSDIDCTIVSDANNRFRYKVTYKQNFWSPAWCLVDECCDHRDSDEYRNTDDYG